MERVWYGGIGSRLRIRSLLCMRSGHPFHFSASHFMCMPLSIIYHLPYLVNCFSGGEAAVQDWVIPCV